MGLIRPDGEINWNCPCLQGMADGPCGQEFRGSFSCFHYSEADPKGSDCIPQFKEMQECFMRHPEVYNGESADDQGSDNKQEISIDEKTDNLTTDQDVTESYESAITEQETESKSLENVIVGNVDIPAS